VEIMTMTIIIMFGEERGFRGERKKTHRQLKSYSSCKIFKFFQIQFYRRVVGIVVLQCITTALDHASQMRKLLNIYKRRRTEVNPNSTGCKIRCYYAEVLTMFLA